MSSSRLLSRFISRRETFKVRCNSVALTSLNSSCVFDIKMSCGVNSDRGMASKCLNLEDINPNVKVMEYAVRGPLVIRGSEIEKELEKVRLFF